MRRRAHLQVDRMTDRQLWSCLGWMIPALDPLNFSYTPGQTHNIAVQAGEVVKELRLRGTQLSLLDSNPQDPA